MKLIVAAFLGLQLVAVQSNATGASKPVKAMQVSAELSRVLLSDEYAKVATDLRHKAEQSGHSLDIQSVATSKAGDETTLTITLVQTTAADIGSKPEVIGEIIAMLTQTPDGKVAIDGLYFKPAAEDPSGVSVGN